MHARKYLAPHQDTNFAIRAAGLLAFPPETQAEPYRVHSLVFRSFYSFQLEYANVHGSHSIPLTAGISSQPSSSKLTTSYSRYHPDPFST